MRPEAELFKTGIQSQDVDIVKAIVRSFIDRLIPSSEFNKSNSKLLAFEFSKNCFFNVEYICFGCEDSLPMKFVFKVTIIDMGAPTSIRIFIYPGKDNQMDFLKMAQ